ncbi:hypothetical protein F2Q69_00038046 [Brassica cretica]|uniref:Uncharacterized protein n=1 Tax=Brassica cretica TaxID=69181 RepID=A0A8S9SRP3_BRACR|nr:hypothetical protein F2Q69_00038046 [Brassica cretica]
MYEEQESKWVKVPERGSFRNHFYRNNQRGDDGGSRYRGDRGDGTIRYSTVENFRAAQGVRRGASLRTGGAGDAWEEGEIRHQDHRTAQRLDEELPLSLPLQGNEAHSTSTQIEDSKVNSVLYSEENGLDVVNEFLDTENNNSEEDSMELGDEQVNQGGDDGEDVENASGEENFQNLTDGEVEESNDQIDDTLGDIKEDDIKVGGTEEKETAVGEEDKKKGARRGLLKPSFVAGGSTKARMVQAYISNRKRTSTKPVNRNGEGSKQEEEKEKEAAAGEEDKKKGAHRGLLRPSLVAGGSTKARMVQAYISNRKRTSTKPVNRNGEGSKQQEEKGTSNPKPHSTKPYSSMDLRAT